MLVGAPGAPALGAMIGAGDSDCSVSSTGMPGSLTVGCWKSVTPACRATCAGTESTWCVTTSAPDMNPAARLSPIV